MSLRRIRSHKSLWGAILVRFQHTVLPALLDATLPAQRPVSFNSLLWFASCCHVAVSAISPVVSLPLDSSGASLLLYRRIKISHFVAVLPVVAPFDEVTRSSKATQEFRTAMTRTGRGSLRDERGCV